MQIILILQSRLYNFQIYVHNFVFACARAFSRVCAFVICSKRVLNSLDRVARRSRDAKRTNVMRCSSAWCARGARGEPARLAPNRSERSEPLRNIIVLRRNFRIWLLFFCLFCACTFSGTSSRIDAARFL